MPSVGARRQISLTAEGAWRCLTRTVMIVQLVCFCDIIRVIISNILLAGIFLTLQMMYSNNSKCYHLMFVLLSVQSQTSNCVFFSFRSLSGDWFPPTCCAHCSSCLHSLYWQVSMHRSYCKSILTRLEYLVISIQELIIRD